MPPDREMEWTLWQKASDMVDAQVDRQWSTTQFFVLLSASVVAGGAALLPFTGSPALAALLACVLGMGAALALVGVRVLHVNKTYYRALVAKRTMLEARLGLDAAIPGFEASALGTYVLGPLATRAKTAEILADPDAYVSPRLRPSSASDWARWVLLGFALFDVAALALVLHAMVGCPLGVVPCGKLGG